VLRKRKVCARGATASSCSRLCGAARAKHLGRTLRDAPQKKISRDLVRAKGLKQENPRQIATVGRGRRGNSAAVAGFLRRAVARRVQ